MNRNVIWLCVIASALFGCAESSEPTDPADSGPHQGQDRVTFWVYAPAAGVTGKAELVLRWKGNGLGPDADSPEATDVPWIGYGRPFRVEWEADFVDAPVAGYKFRASQRANVPFLPRDETGNSVFGNVTSFSYDNATPASLLVGQDCEGGPDCPELLRFDSGPYRLEMVAENLNGLLSDRDQGLLEFEINYPPETTLPVGDDVCDDDKTFPHYVYVPDDGDPVVCAIQPGQVIPAGSTVHLRAAGYDRTDPAVSDPAICCDLRLDLENPEVRYQTRLEMVGEADSGLPVEFATVFSVVQDADVFFFEVAPLEYTVRVRSVDEHGRRDPSDATFTFSAGLEPSVTSVYPDDGARVVLRDPQLGAPWPENEVPYEVSGPDIRYWDPNFGRFLNSPTADTIAIGGRWFRFPLQFTGASNPQEPPPSGVKSWAYEMVGEYDPNNQVPNGGGSERLDLFFNSTELNALELIGDDRVSIFVPDQFWTNFELLDPDGDCPAQYLCDIGDELRRNLGEHTLRVRGRSTWTGEIFKQGLPEATFNSTPRTDLEIGSLGRRTETVTQTMEMVIGRADESGTLTSYWPD